MNKSWLLVEKLSRYDSFFFFQIWHRHINVAIFVTSEIFKYYLAFRSFPTWNYYKNLRCYAFGFLRVLCYLLCSNAKVMLSKRRRHHEVAPVVVLTVFHIPWAMSKSNKYILDKFYEITFHCFE